MDEPRANRRIDNDELDELREWVKQDMDERFSIAQLIDRIDEAERANRMSINIANGLKDQVDYLLAEVKRLEAQ